MSHGGSRPNAGRKKGKPGKKQRALVEKAESGGQMPVEYLLEVMRDPTNDQKDRMEAAKSAAPYLHARLAAVEVTGKDGGPIQTEEVLSDFELARRVAFMLERGRLLAKG